MPDLLHGKWVNNFTLIFRFIDWLKLLTHESHDTYSALDYFSVRKSQKESFCADLVRLKCAKCSVVCEVLSGIHSPFSVLIEKMHHFSLLKIKGTLAFLSHVFLGTTS